MALERPCFLYYLADPRTEVRYVGYTHDCRKRMWAHLDVKDRDQTHRARWIRKLFRDGLVPVMVPKAKLQTKAAVRRWKVVRDGACA
jgi:predicted GIY-YIG superfamily endonuclease